MTAETFRIKPDPKRPGFFAVYVAETYAAMHAVIRGMDDSYRSDRSIGRLGACVFGAVGHGRYRHLLGFVFLAKPSLTGPIVAHELAHAAFRTCNRRGIQVRHWSRTSGRTLAQRHRSAEERYCRILEQLHADFWREAARRRLA